jgi:hypothetical protein
MTASLPINASSPFAGLGTAQATITTAGLYTVSFKSFLPYLASGTAVTAAPVNNIVNVTCAADVSGSKNSTYWTFYSAGNAYGYYVWYNINSAGVDPAPTGLTGIEVDGATGASAATLATATIAAIAASTAASYVTASAGTSGHVILTNVQYGSLTAAANGTASYGASFSVTQAGSDGTPAASGLSVVIKQNSTVKATYAFPTPTQPILGGSVTINAAASDTVSIVIASQSTADAALNSVKSILNLYQGQGS